MFRSAVLLLLACPCTCIRQTAQFGMDDQIPIEDTNMALVGTSAHHAMVKAAALTDPAWQNVLKPEWVVENQKVLATNELNEVTSSTLVWRVENFEVKSWPLEQYGKFHQGDCYIVMHTLIVEDENHPGSFDDKRWIYFWLGNETSLDELGTVAWKVVELDDVFDSEPVQRREIMKGETEPFSFLFPEGVEYLPGGVATGFHKSIKMTALMEVNFWKIERNKEPYEVERDFSHIERAEGQEAEAVCFVLDATRYAKILMWCGKGKGVAHVRYAARSKAEQCERDSLGKARAEDVSPGKKHKLQEENLAFFHRMLRADARTTEGVLYKMQIADDDKGDMKFEEIAIGDLKKSQLERKDVMMLVTRKGVKNGQVQTLNEHQIFVWLGREANLAEKKNAMRVATAYCTVNALEISPERITLLKDAKGGSSGSQVWDEIFSN